MHQDPLWELAVTFTHQAFSENKDESATPFLQTLERAGWSYALDESLGDCEETVRVLVYGHEQTELQQLAFHAEAQAGFLRARLNLTRPDAWLHAWHDELRSFVTGHLYVELGGQTLPSEHIQHKLRVSLPATSAFGTGQHATTRAMLRLLEPRAGQATSCLDIGTGTGILAIAAGILGVPHIVATECDPEACDAARTNIASNTVTIDLRLESDVPQGFSFDLIMVNILYPGFVPLLGALKTALAEGGTLVLAGFAERDAGDVWAHCQKYGWRRLEETIENGWPAWALSR